MCDNAGHPEQVRPLLPAGPGSLTLVTSRDRLSGLVARDGARRVELDPLTADEAVTLLTRAVGARIDAEPQAASDLADACAYLPLALRITAARLIDDPCRGVAGHLAELSAGHRMDALRIDGDDRSSVPAAFDQSYSALKPELRRLFRLLGLVPGPDVTGEAAAALSDTSPVEARRGLDRLAAGYLVEYRGPGRYGLHDLLRDYADARVGDAERSPAIQRLFDWYLHTADAADRLVYQHPARLSVPTTAGARSYAFDDPTGAWRFLDAERANLVAAIRHAAVHGPRPVAWLLTDALAGYFFHRRHAADWLVAGRHALMAAEAADEPTGRAVADLVLGQALACVGDHSPAIGCYEQALAHTRRAGWLSGEISALNKLALSHNANGRPDLANRYLGQALDRSVHAGEVRLQATCLLHLGTVALHTGALAHAVDHYRRCLDLPDVPGAVMAAMALTGLGCAQGCLGHFDEAVDHLTRALGMHRATGGRHGEAMALRNLAETYLDAGNHGRAREFADNAVAVAHDAADQRTRAAALNILGAVHHATGEPSAAAARHREALDLTATAPGDHHHTAARIGLATSLLALGHADEARPHAEPALTAARHAGHQILHGRALTVLAGIHLAGGDRTRAADLARHAVAIHRDTGYRVEQARALVVLGHAADDPSLYWSEATDLLDALGVPQTARPATTRRAGRLRLLGRPATVDELRALLPEDVAG